METSAKTRQDSSPKYTRKDTIRYLVRSFFGVVILGVILFLSAGTAGWIWGWVYLLLFSLVTITSTVLTDPELLVEERGLGREGRKMWDLRLLSIYGLLSSLVSPIVAGLDYRFGWSGSFALWLQILGVIIFITSWYIGLWAMAENRYFSKVVRIQTERGHTVVTTGPYRYIRHPGYVNAITFSLSTPLILGSAWTLIPSLIAAALIVLRTSLEDQMLHEELSGYPEYAMKVRYRLIPGLW
jgi:protein-S-isoprenylcysteine O-methyltransferase Ste14